MLKKRLLFVNGHVNVGGIEKSLVDLLRHLDYEKYEVDLLLLEDKGHYLDEVPHHVHIIFRDLTNTHGSVASSLKRCFSMRDWLGIRMRLAFLLGKIFGPKSLRIARVPLFGKTEYDCAVGYRHGVCSDLVAYVVKAKRKLTWWHHGEWNMNADQSAEYEKSCTFFDRVVTVSDGCASMLAREIPSISGRLTVIPNMLDVAAVRSKALRFNPYPQQQLRFVTVGRLSPEKHIENAVNAAELLMQRGLSGFCWHIIGEGPERGKIEKIIQDKNLEHVFSLEGCQSNPYPYMKYADLFVHTSYVESQGLTILESMAIGVPCIVTRSVGPECYIKNGENGFLVDQDVDSLVEAIGKFIHSPSDYEALRSRTCCPPEFFPESIVRRFEDLLVV